MTQNMTRFASHSLAALAAVLLALTSIGTIVSVPDASAHTANGVGTAIELA